MIIRPNQPIVFNRPVNECLLNQKQYSQLVQGGDVSQLQIEVDTCADIDSVVANGGFDTGGVWTYTGAFARFVNPITGEANAGIPTSNTGSCYQDCLALNNYYKVEIDVVSITEGGINVYLGTNLIATLTQQGAYELYGFCLTNTVLTIEAAGTSQFYVDDIAAYFVPYNYVLPFYDSDDIFITEIRVADIISAADPVNENASLVDKYLTIFINWTTLGVINTCAYFCVLDPCVNTCMQNGEFDEDFAQDDTVPTSTRWVLTHPPLGGFINITNGILTASVNTLNDTALATQNGVCAGKTYDLTIKIDSITNGRVRVFYGTAGASFTTAGTHTAQITANGTDHYVEFEKTGGGAASASVDFVRSRIQTDEYSCDNQSNLFDVQNVQACTSLINVCNEEDSFYFGFGDTGFSPQIRLNAKLINPRYEYDREIKEDTEGKKSVHFFKRRKIEVFSVDYQPDFIHDFLSLLAGFDHVYIDGTEYVVESEGYDPEYLEDEDNIARIDIEVSERTQDMRNENCTGADTGGCSPPPNYVIEPDTGGDTEYLLDPETLDFITSLEF